MANLNGNDPNRLLNEVRAIDRTVDELQGEMDRIKAMQKRYMDDTNTADDSDIKRELNRLGDGIMTKYRALTDRVMVLKQDPQSGNPRNAPQIGKVKRRLQTMLTAYQKVENDFRKQLEERNAREYRIVRPDASEAEIREATSDENAQIFSQAVRLSL
jgi:syntaxin 1B/2/3